LLREIEISHGSTQAHRAAAAIERMGDQAIQVLVKQFPGKLRVDHFSAAGKLPPVAEHSAVLRLLVNFGRPSVRHVLPLLSSPNDDIRFYATYIFSELVFAEVVPHVAQRLQDSEYAIRAVAVEVLRRYLATPEMQEVLEGLRGDLPGPEAVRQRYAAEALGELRDVPAIPRLIELVDHRDTAIAGAARQALLVITKQDFAHRQRPWRNWWQKNRGRHRIEWMLEGLAHGVPEIRLSASEELRRLTHEHFGYHFDLPKREREDARLKWVAWWEHVGRKTHTGLDS
jgi:HEAT repeat protein